MKATNIVVKRFEVWRVTLDPTQGGEITKTRPCLVISPNEVNKNLKTVLVAPLTHSQKGFPTRVDCQFDNQNGQVALDQIRAVDKTIRLVEKLGILDTLTCAKVCKTLEEMFKF
ncbi:hypothetical protein EMA8858_00072 [Emticicia aquatica]|jgi:mRNA interferase MazF|uniref:mRNA interferase n=1 Tax=Emticicia aquatica TaxID=1681835 RepID=A0ABM9AJS5_9BACT|nr:type II toxin-antitoxin system PemK/MazF family toxin [Emticicia aquatica]CAH0993967.1 hypothetical protein EMA8858_00072 [Emticicia aquatica]